MTPSQPTKPDPGPADRLRDPASRNAIFGWLGIFVVVLLLAASIVLAGPGLSLVALASALVVLGVLWVLLQLGLPHQPGGRFLSATITAFAALLVPLTVGVLLSAQRTQQMSLAGPETPSISLPASATPAPELPLLADEFSMERPDPEKQDYVEVLQDSKIRIEGKYYRIKGGEQYILHRVADENVIFRTRDFRISLPTDAVRVHRARKSAAEAAPAVTEASTPESQRPSVGNPEAGAGNPPSALAATRAAQERAIQKYPALSIKDSRENRAYVEAYMQLKESNPSFFDDPEWPYQLAAALAERDGWKIEAGPEPEPEPEQSPETEE